MTLADAFDIYTRDLHLRTIRRYLGWCVLNAANTNTRAAFLPSLSHGQPREVGSVPLGLTSRICQIDTHTPSHSGDVA